jgi:hypothetical protein
MAALSAATLRKYVGQQDEISAPLGASDTFYRGAVLTFAADGYASVPTDAAGLFPAGIVTGEFEDGDKTDEKVVAASAHPRAILRRGKVWLPLASVAETDRGETAYLADDNTLTQTAGSKTVQLVILDVDTTNDLALVDLRFAFIDTTGA